MYVLNLRQVKQRHSNALSVREQPQESASSLPPSDIEPSTTPNGDVFDCLFGETLATNFNRQQEYRRNREYRRRVDSLDQQLKEQQASEACIKVLGFRDLGQHLAKRSLDSVRKQLANHPAFPAGF